jgi:hypothetical protein
LGGDDGGGTTVTVAFADVVVAIAFDVNVVDLLAVVVPFAETTGIDGLADTNSGRTEEDGAGLDPTGARFNPSHETGSHSTSTIPSISFAINRNPCLDKSIPFV